MVYYVLGLMCLIVMSFQFEDIWGLLSSVCIMGFFCFSLEIFVF